MTDKINVEFQLETSNLQHDIVASKDFVILARIEGILIVTINNHVFFKEGGTLLLELARDLYKWLSNKKELKDFQYTTMDYDEEPILEVLKTNNHFEVKSIWSEFNCTIEFTEQEIRTAFADFLDRLRKKLESHFQINIEDYL